jgi:hypothetical protein
MACRGHSNRAQLLCGVCGGSRVMMRVRVWLREGCREVGDHGQEVKGRRAGAERQ